MSPIDDELRSTLSSRSETVELSPGFLDGVERRARGMRRQRVAASVAGSALAVAALGVGGPMLASSLTSSTPDRAPVATAPPTAVTPATEYALDLDAPWEYRGERALLDEGSLATANREWATRHDVALDDVTMWPLFGQVWEPAGTGEVVYLVHEAGTGEHWYGVVQYSESGPELAVDRQLLDPAPTALAVSLPGDEVARVLVVAAPGVDAVEYAPDAASEWSELAPLEPGVATGPLDGDPASDSLRVLADGDVVFQGEVPDLEADRSAGPTGEGPGTETPVDVDPAPYALDVDAPWAYRGPAELQQHPNLAADDEELFTAADIVPVGEWSQRPLLAVERPDGLSILMVLRTDGEQAWVSTTWQRQDEAPRQNRQQVADGRLVVQSYLPQSDGTGVHVALAAPRTGAVEMDVPAAEQLVNEEGWGLWTLPSEHGSGELFLYSEGDGLLFHSETARVS
jgi:hypothetical protein